VKRPLLIGPRMRPAIKGGFGKFRSGGAMKGVRERAVSAPLSKQISYGVGAPQFNGGKPIRVQHREFLQTINSVTAFDGTSPYLLNPGLADNFPWLSQIAQSFEQYRFRMLRYVYRNRCPSTTAATIYSATQFDSNDATFASIEDLMDYSKTARSDIAWSSFNMNCRLGAGRFVKKLFVRTDSLITGEDANLYDSGKFTICGVSGTAGTYLGDLLVEYDVEFTNPKKNPAFVGAMGAYIVAQGTNTASWEQYPLLNAGVATPASANFAADVLPVITNASSASEVKFPVPGMYSIDYILDDPGSTFQATSFNITPQTSFDSSNSFIDYGKVLSTIGKGLILTAKIYTFAANVRYAYTGLATGTTAGTWTANLVIFCEAANAFLGWVGENPTPPSPVAVRNYVMRHPKCPYGKKMLMRIQDDAKRAEYYRTRSIQDRKIELLVGELTEEKHLEEVIPELPSRVENSDSEPELVMAERSRSRDPREKKSKKSDLKNRKV